MREREPEADVEYGDVVFADDVRCVKPSPPLVMLGRAARSSGSNQRDILTAMALELNEEKSENLV